VAIAGVAPHDVADTVVIEVASADRAPTRSQMSMLL
jgi:hypothetical protein